MLRDPHDNRAGVGRVRSHARAALALAIAVLALVIATAAQAAPWRAFSNASVWNVPAAPQSIAPSNPYADQFPAGKQMELSGTPDNPTYSSPIYFASPGDPVAPVNVTIPDWAPQGVIRWDGKPIPVPAGVTPASGSDGHLTVVSADRRTSWEMWRCTSAGPAGYTAAIIVQFDLTGPGYSNKMDDTSARGSGTPLISTTLRADEALSGVNHALGITVPNVGGSPVYPPATHTDGGGGGIEYGMLFVLRPDYPVSPGASVGVRNVIQALKTYGAYVVDQGADFEMDADFTHPELWRQAGLSQTSFDFTGADMRPAQPGAPQAQAASAAPARKKRSRNRAIALHAHRHSVWVGGRLRLRGKVRGNIAPGAKVRLQVRTHGHWKRFRQKLVEANGTFATHPHLGRVAGASRHGHRALRLRERRLRSGMRVLRVRAVVKGVGRSRVLKIRVRRHHR